MGSWGWDGENHSLILKRQIKILKRKGCIRDSNAGSASIKIKADTTTNTFMDHLHGHLLPWIYLILYYLIRTTFLLCECNIQLSESVEFTDLERITNMFL